MTDETDEKTAPSGEHLPVVAPESTAVAASGSPQPLEQPPAVDSSPTLEKTLPPPVPELNLDKRLKQLYADQLMTTTEFAGLRDDADRLFEELKATFPKNGYLKLFEPLADVVVEAMQFAVLEVRKGKPDAEAKALVRQSLGFQVAYIKASLDRLTQSL